MLNGPPERRRGGRGGSGGSGDRRCPVPPIGEGKRGTRHHLLPRCPEKGVRKRSTERAGILAGHCLEKQPHGGRRNCYGD